MKKLGWLSLLIILAMACQDDQVLQKENKNVSVNPAQKFKDRAGARLTTETGVNCNESMLFSLDANGIPTGSVEVAVDATDIHITYDLTGDEWFLLDISAFAGDCDAIPDPANYPIFQSFSSDDEIRLYNFDIPLANLPDCGCISLLATVARFNSSSSQIEDFPAPIHTEYCNCDEPEEPDDKPLRTQTPGGWGAPPEGNNPGAYLHANFASAFPGGLTVGCTYTIKFTTAQAITDYMPRGGTPAALTTSYVNPVALPKNSLAHHVIALKLSVGFDAWDEDFGESNTSLANAVVTEGTFEGWTVAEVLAEAEKKLGGCASSYTASALSDVLEDINESFVDGTTNTGFLENGN